MVAITSPVAVLLWAGSHSTQLLFYTAWERMTAEYLFATNGDLGREQGIPETTRTIKDGSHPEEATEEVESTFFGWAASFGVVRWVGLGAG